MQIEQKIHEILERSLLGLGYEIVKIKYLNKGKANVLQVMIERTDQKPITVDDCEKASHAVSALLDVEDPISNAYNLEVSSAGIDRPLVKLKDYVKYKGYDISVCLFTPLDSKKNFQGKLEKIIENNVVINTGTVRHQVSIQNIASAKLVLNEKLLKKIEQNSN